MNLAEKDKKYIWHPFTQMRDWVRENPLVIAGGKGVYLKDVNGRRYIDGNSSLWVNVHGHRNPALNAAVKKQLNKAAHTTFLGLTHPKAIELAEALVQIAPKGLTKVFFSDGGAEAVEIALKMAFQYWQNKGVSGKIRFVSLIDAYHGDTIGAVSVGKVDLFHKIYKPLLFKAIRVVAGDIRELEKVLAKGNKEIAAVILEPLVQAAGGILVMPRGYLKAVRRLCDKYNVLLIADEVATGFGRTGKMFACEHERVTPDIMCLGKGISGGYLPIAATIVKEKIYGAFLAPYKERKTFFHGHTYTANPLCCAAAVENLKLFKKNRLLDKLQPKIKFMEKRLTRFLTLPHVGAVRQLGFIAGIELVKDKTSMRPYGWEEKIGIKVNKEVRRRGAIIRPLGNVIVIIPPLVITLKDLSKLLKIAYESIKKATEG